ncbi:MAG TPA: carbohydrate ABC transporter permease [Chloroflexota bacterium]|nr:carbohydrate ABC transporter permease [Chloroflexota bacterium]
MRSTETIRSTRLRVKSRIAVGVTNAILIALIGVVALPFVTMVLGSFKPQYELFSFPVRFLPSRLYTVNYEKLFAETMFVRWYANTLFVALTRTLLSLFLCTLAGFAFAKYEFRFKKPLFIFVIATFTLPFQVVLVPLYKMSQAFGWVNTYWVLIIPFAANAFIIFLARQYILAVPSELLEAARIDGAGELTIFWRIVVPILKPALAVMSILLFNQAWNDYLWPLIVINDQKLFILNLALPALRGPYGNEYGLVLAGATLATIPVVAVFVFMQRQFIEGIMAGALKS